MQQTDIYPVNKHRYYLAYDNDTNGTCLMDIFFQDNLGEPVPEFLYSGFYCSQG